MHFFIEQLGHINDFVIDVADLVALPELIENDRLGDAEIDPFEEAHIADILPAALPDHRQDAEILAVVENGREVVRDRQISGVGMVMGRWHDSSLMIPWRNRRMQMEPSAKKHYGAVEMWRAPAVPRATVGGRRSVRP